MPDASPEKVVNRVSRRSYRRTPSRLPYHLLRGAAYVLLVSGVALLIWIPAAMFSGKTHKSSAIAHTAAASSGGVKDAKDLLVIGAATGLLGYALLRVHGQWDEGAPRPSRRR